MMTAPAPLPTSTRNWSWMILTDEDRPTLLMEGRNHTDATRPIVAATARHAVCAFMDLLASHALVPVRVEFVETSTIVSGACLRAWVRPEAGS